MTEIDYALNQDNTKDQIELIGTILWNKTEKLSGFENLSLPERQFIYIDIFESEINDNGIYGFFVNTSGKYAHEVLQAFEAIGATENATIIDKAIRMFPELPVPKDIFNRRTIMQTLSENTKNSWLDLETKLVASKEDIVSLLISFVTKHKSHFNY